jgi:hypothetical protein
MPESYYWIGIQNVLDAARHAHQNKISVNHRQILFGFARFSRMGSFFSKVFSQNLHPVERVLRVAVGAAGIAAAVAGPKNPWGYLGAIPLVTGLVGSCPLYRLFGLSTKKSQAVEISS